MNIIHSLLAQMDPGKLRGAGLPEIQGTSSTFLTWVLAGVLAVGIILITFKTSKRNHLERD